MASDSIHLKYLVISPQDKKIGLTISSVGTQSVAPGESYPPMHHPTRYHFDPLKGRVLSEFQLLILTKGSGFFSSASCPTVRVGEGDMFLLFPGEWHTYHPDETTGWTEMWIGFTGTIADMWLQSEIISPSVPVFHVGVKEDIIDLYKQAMRFADHQESGYQQVLCGLVCNMLSKCLFYHRNYVYRVDRIQDLMNECRNYIRDNIATVTPEDVAGRVSMGYSKMRKLFKQYTGLAMGQYIAEMRTNKGKELLSSTDMPIGEIAFELGFENEEYFSTYFKRITSQSPSQYRRGTRQDQIKKPPRDAVE